MTHLDHHRIQRQVVDLRVPSGAQAPALQEAVARSLRDRTGPELQAVFDRAAGPDELLRVDRLEIDVGRVDGAEWEPQFRRKLVAELARALAGLQGAATGSAQAHRDHSPKADALRQFLFFLVHGRLPWWGAPPTRGWTDALEGDLDIEGWAALHRTVLAQPRARVRLVQSADDAFLEAAMVHWAALPHAAEVMVRMTPQALKPAAHARWRRDAWMLLFDAVLGGAVLRGGGPALMFALSALRAARESAAHQGAVQPAHPPGSRPEAAPVRPVDLPQPWRGWLQSAPAAREPSADAPAMRPEDGAANLRILMPAAPRTGPASRQAIALPAEGEAIYLPGAGAVLLHPFLQELFGRSGLLEGADFRDAPARDRGVHLLGLLAFGGTDVPEHQLLLPKLLCGCPFDEPLEPVDLDEEDQARCDALLRAVLGHWTALRSSSPAWLRAQFFLREGKLEDVDGGVRLTLERRAQDVLLARLPWGIGAFGLPWLRQRIFVHWLD